MRKFYTHLLLSILPLFISLSSCTGNKGEQKELVARAGDRSIDWTLLNRSYHLDPKWGKGLTFKQAYKNQLEYLVDQKLFAQAAISRNLDKDSENEKYLTFIKEKEMIKELYRRDVESQIEISEEEYRSAYRKLKTKIKLAYITTPDRQSADKYLKMIDEKSIDSLILFDPAHEEKGKTPFFSFGEMAEEIDNIAFDLPLNETAGPLNIDNKFMVIKLIDGSRDKIFSESDFEESKSKIQQIIFERKASRLSNQYIFQLLKNEDVKLNPEAFFVLAEHFNTIVQKEDGRQPLPINLSDLELKQVEINITDIKEEILVTYNRGQMTVAEFIAKLWNMPAGIRPMVKMSQNLKLAIGIIVRNKYLAEKAYAANLNTVEKVLFETQWQSDQYLARQWLTNIRAQISVSPDEIISFLKSEDYLTIQKRSKKELTHKEVEDLLIDFKFTEAKMKTADSLKMVYEVDVDSTIFFSKIKSPDEIIKDNPIKLIYREKFN